MKHLRLRLHAYCPLLTMTPEVLQLDKPLCPEPVACPLLETLAIVLPPQAHAMQNHPHCVKWTTKQREVENLMEQRGDATMMERRQLLGLAASPAPATSWGFLRHGSEQVCPRIREARIYRCSHAPQARPSLVADLYCSDLVARRTTHSPLQQLCNHYHCKAVFMTGTTAEDDEGVFGNHFEDVVDQFQPLWGYTRWNARLPLATPGMHASDWNPRTRSIRGFQDKDVQEAVGGGAT